MKSTNQQTHFDKVVEHHSRASLNGAIQQQRLKSRSKFLTRAKVLNMLFQQKFIEMNCWRYSKLSNTTKMERSISLARGIRTPISSDSCQNVFGVCF